MALKNTQYDEIMREYYRKQTEDRHEQEERIRRATEALPELAAIDHEIASLSVSSARKALEGDETALSHLREDIKALSEKKTELLTSHGYPADYLEMHYHCPDCQDTGYIGQEKCHCFRQAVIDLLYTQSNIRDILEEENFDHFSFRYYSDTSVSPTTGLSSLVTMKKLVAESMDFIRNFDTDFQNFFFYGDTGVGKTFLSNCIAKELMDSGLIAGGMIPKTRNCIHAVEHGVGSVTVLDGRMEHAILLESISEKSLGTTLEKKR